ncbi:aspartate/glutamate racemase family protein [Sterolibacterium denitrificans]|uniref:aspartate/glutamate racemase family protein n=1 Tax=Sterolibacterium denitrificans TaxID=157592 RepID=UPI0009FA8BA7|nr:amino acid racemase [Sterolibacterium denitrificans]
MPKIDPINSVQTWSQNEKTLGIVGMSPFAVLNFLNTFYSLIPATKEWQYPRVLLDINTKIPSRGRYFELNEEEPSSYIAQTIKELASNGADCILIPCNTVHIIQDKWSEASPVPIISIVDAVVSEAKRLGGKITALGTITTTSRRLYSSLLEKGGVKVVDIELKEQQLITSIIESIKKNGGTKELEGGLICFLNDLERKGVTSIILGCTELSHIKSFIEKQGFTVIDSNEALAKDAIKYIMC